MSQSGVERQASLRTNIGTEASGGRSPVACDDGRHSGPVLGTLVLKDEIKGHGPARWFSR